MENGDETLASPTAAAEKTALNGGVVDEEQVPITQPAKSYAAVAAENPAPNGGIAEEEEGEGVAAAHTTAKSYAAVAAENPAPNGDIAKEEEEEGEGVTSAHTTTKSYAAVAASAEIEDLRAAKLDLDGKLAEARRENKALAEETHRIEGIFLQAREEVTTAEIAATSAENELAPLRKEVYRLYTALQIEKGEHELDKSRNNNLAEELDAVRQEKLKLEEEIRALKASATAAATKEREAAPAAEAPKEGEAAWLGMAAAAAAGAAVLIYLRLKR